MLGSAFLAAIIPFLMWLFQKATKTDSPENKRLNITIFAVLFLILGIWDISVSLGTYIDYFEKYGNSNTSEILSRKVALKFIMYGVVIIPTLWSYKSKIGINLGKIFSGLKKNNSAIYSNPKEIKRKNASSYKNNNEVIKERLYCPNCYAEVNKEDLFCGECGYQLKVEEEIEPTPIEKITQAKQTKLVKEKVKEIKEKVKEKVKEIKSPPETTSTKEQLKEYKQLFDEGLISEEEYKALKKKALNL